MFCSLPGVGQKTAQRYAYAVIDMSEEQANEFCRAITDVKRNVKFCRECGFFTENDVCDICKKRDKSVICVVAYPKDVLAIEKAGLLRVFIMFCTARFRRWTAEDPTILILNRCLVDWTE